MKSLLFIATGMLACIVILVSIILIVTHHPKQTSSINRHNSIATGNETSKTTTPLRPTENCAQFPLAEGCGVVGAPINICSKQYPNYPPLSDILTTKAKPDVGMYVGTITNVNYGLHAIT